MNFSNQTALSSRKLRSLFLRHTAPYRHDGLTVNVRYSRGADFSGTCFYNHARIHVNLGRRNCYPYLIATHIAKARSNRRFWWRQTFYVRLVDAYQLALFVYLHELYHHLVKLAGRSPRRKEAMCDRFATRALVGEYACPVFDRSGAAVERGLWDFQDLDGFVSAAPRIGSACDAQRPIPVLIRGL